MPPQEIVRKNKGLAILLAFLMGPSSWLYTYNQDKKKLWIGISISLVLAIVFVILLVAFSLSLDEAEAESVQGFLDIIPLLDGSWLFAFLGVVLAGLSLVMWTVVDRITKPQSWYERYPRAPLDKTLAVVLAVFFAYATWLYTYEENSTKFWIGFGVWFFASVLFNAAGATGLANLASLIILGIWVWVIIDAATKDSRWYESFPSSQNQSPPVIQQ